MGEGRNTRSGGKTVWAASSVVMPIVILLIVVAVIVGLVAGGVLQGQASRAGPEAPSSTVTTIVIEL